MQDDGMQMQEPCIQPMIPTDFFRDLIYTTDFMQDEDNGGMQI